MIKHTVNKIAGSCSEACCWISPKRGAPGGRVLTSKARTPHTAIAPDSRAWARRSSRLAVAGPPHEPWAYWEGEVVEGGLREIRDKIIIEMIIRPCVRPYGFYTEGTPRTIGARTRGTKYHAPCHARSDWWCITPS
jgi:hypothetical protein